MKTVNLQLSKKLKEAGYPQENHAYYFDIYHIGKADEIVELYPQKQKTNEHFSSFVSPTADELLDQLPSAIHGTFFLYIWKDDAGLYRIVYCSSADLAFGGKQPNYQIEKQKSLADAAALMWIYLKEHSLISQKEKL